MQKKAKRRSDLSGYKKYKSYPFIEYDPILTVINDFRDQSGVQTKDLVTASSLSPSTLANWKKKKTKRPQFATVAAAAAALGLTQLPITAEARKKFK
jgi:transcriptional regulator with XRE-family HTH domain